MTTPAYLPVFAKVTSCPNCRSAEQLAAVVQQFNVATDARYQPQGGTTFCNIFVWDVTRALAAEIPHWWVGHEMNANALYDWLSAHGGDYGWTACSADDASAAAAAGKPAVAVWKNPSGGPGHIAVVIPTPDGLSGVYIAQAGARCFYGEALNHGFGNLVPTYYRND
jgi:hypothetical protein